MGSVVNPKQTEVRCLEASAACLRAVPHSSARSERGKNVLETPGGGTILLGVNTQQLVLWPKDVSWYECLWVQLLFESLLAVTSKNGGSEAQPIEPARKTVILESL